MGPSRACSANAFSPESMLAVETAFIFVVIFRMIIFTTVKYDWSYNVPGEQLWKVISRG